MANPPPIKPAAIAVFRANPRTKCERDGIAIAPALRTALDAVAADLGIAPPA